MTTRALSFGSVASVYERLRPGYPDELVDQVLAHAVTPVRTALEIGAGTGKASRAFIRRDIALTATEPDAAMLTELRAHVPASVVTRQNSLEDLPRIGTFDLVFAAAALHWTEPAGRWARIAALLNPSGVFASFGGPIRLGDPEVAEAVRVARSPDLEDDDVPSPDGTAPDSALQWPGTELLESDLFTAVSQSLVERRTTMCAQDYVDHLSTISAYLELPRTQREQVFERIRHVVPERVEVVADLTLHLARLA